MVRKTKRKQTLIPFEKSGDAVLVDLSLCSDLLTTDENHSDTLFISNVLKSLNDCDSVLQQTKILQENKSNFKSIIGKKIDGNDSDNKEKLKRVRVIYV